MKRKIIFYITVGSYWPSERGESFLGTFELPKGGMWAIKEIIYDTDEKEFNNKCLDDAREELKKQMEGQSYHIWYWVWDTNYEG